MRKFIYSVISLGVMAAMATSCDLFKLDNYEQPNAQVTGKITDPQGNGIQCDKGSNCGTLNLIEDVSDRWNVTTTPTAMTWNVKFDGSYTNNLVFAGKYAVELSSLPVFVHGYKDTIIIRKGANVINFENKVPFCYITDVNFSYQGTKIVAKFKVTPGMADKANEIVAVGLYSSYSNFVSQTFYLTKVEEKNDLVAGEEITLELETAGQSEFQYERNHYLRIGAVVANSEFNPKKLYNHSEIYVMDKNHEFSVYDWSTAAEN